MCPKVRVAQARSYGPITRLCIRNRRLGLVRIEEQPGAASRRGPSRPAIVYSGFPRRGVNRPRLLRRGPFPNKRTRRPFFVYSRVCVVLSNTVGVEDKTKTDLVFCLVVFPNTGFSLIAVCGIQWSRSNHIDCGRSRPFPRDPRHEDSHWVS